MTLFRCFSLATVLTALCSCSSTIEMPKHTSAGYTSARFVVADSRNRVASTAPEQDPAFNAAIKESLRKEFASQGISVGGEQADLIIAYMLIRQNSASTTMNRDYFGNGRNAMTILEEAHERGVIQNKSPDDFIHGAIVIDVLDAQTNKLIFRNFAVRPVTAQVDAATRQRRIDSAVAQALAPFFKK